MDAIGLISVGQLNIGGMIDITDPSYERNVWCRMNDIEIMPGKYNCYVYVIDEDEWGNRVSCIAIVHDLEPEWNGKFNEFPEQIGEIGVDTAMAGFFVDKPDYTKESWYQFCDTMREKKWLLTGDSFLSDTGLGDGCYPVYVRRGERGLPVGLLIRFL